MPTVLVASASVHTTAAACDYLAPRLGPDDTVIVLTVTEPGIADRDAGDAANVARARLVEPAVETLVRDGDPATVIAAVADEREVEEVVVGATRGDPDATGESPGSTVRDLLDAAQCPITVLPATAP